MDQKLISDLKIISGKLHEILLDLCCKYPAMVNVINLFILKEVMINNYLFSENEQEAFRIQMEAQRVAQSEYDELKLLDGKKNES